MNCLRCGFALLKDQRIQVASVKNETYAHEDHRICITRLKSALAERDTLLMECLDGVDEYDEFWDTNHKLGDRIERTLKQDGDG